MERRLLYFLDSCCILRTLGYNKQYNSEKLVANLKVKEKKVDIVRDITNTFLDKKVLQLTCAIYKYLVAKLV